MDALKSYRKEIESIDKKILVLLHKRFSVAKKIGTHKRARGLKLLDKIRERELLRLVIKEGKKLGITPSSTKSIWRAILREALSKE